MEDEVSLTDLVYSTTTTDMVSSDEASSTFSSGAGSASSTSVGIAVAFIVAAVVACVCIGANMGRCWLHKERERRNALKVVMVG